MALGKSIQTKSGVAATYWRLVSVQVDSKNQVISAELDGYVDEATRRAGGSPLESVEYSSKVVHHGQVSHNDYSSIILASAPMLSTIYGYFKAMPEFSGCSDC